MEQTGPNNDSISLNQNGNADHLYKDRVHPAQYKNQQLNSSSFSSNDTISDAKRVKHDAQERIYPHIVERADATSGHGKSQPPHHLQNAISHPSNHRQSISSYTSYDINGASNNPRISQMPKSASTGLSPTQSHTKSSNYKNQEHASYFPTHQQSSALDIPRSHQKQSTDLLPSCSYSIPKNCEYALHNKSKTTSDNELFSSSARAFTPPSFTMMQHSQDVNPVDHTLSIAIAADDAQGNKPDKIYSSNTRNTVIPQSEASFNSSREISTKVSDNNKYPRSEAIPTEDPINVTGSIATSPSERKESNSKQSIDEQTCITAINTDIKTTENENKDENEELSKDSFVKLLRPVLSTLLSSPEAQSLRSLLDDPDHLLSEMVRKWGGSPSNDEDDLQRMRQNFDTFLKQFITPEKCSEWGWEGRPVEYILRLLNAENRKYFFFFFKV